MKKYDIKDLIRVANEEYKENGDSSLFEVCQKMVIENTKRIWGWYGFDI